jgi:uncharacterized membrane protein YidH (DUF202 family)
MADDPRLLSYLSARPRHRRRDTRPAQSSLALGILAVLGIFICFLGVPFGILALVVGIRAIQQMNRSSRYGGLWFAIAGISLGTIALMVTIVEVLVMVGEQ